MRSWRGWNWTDGNFWGSGLQPPNFVIYQTRSAKRYLFGFFVVFPALLLTTLFLDTHPTPYYWYIFVPFVIYFVWLLTPLIADYVPTTWIKVYKYYSLKHGKYAEIHQRNSVLIQQKFQRFFPGIFGNVEQDPMQYMLKLNRETSNCVLDLLQSGGFNRVVVESNLLSEEHTRKKLIRSVVLKNPNIQCTVSVRRMSLLHAVKMAIITVRPNKKHDIGRIEFFV